MKQPAVLLLAATVALTLITGCSSPQNSAGEACAPTGEQSEAVEVSGEFASRDLSIDLDTPVQVSELQRSVARAGKGDDIATGDSVQAMVSVFSGEDGTRVSAESARLTNTGASDEWTADALRCSVPGDRVVVVLPAADVYGAGRVSASGITGLAEDSALIVVLDVQETVPGLPDTMSQEQLLSRAAGTSVPAPEGYPRVELDDSGEPTIVMPNDEAPPTETQVHTLIEGAGETVQAGDRVYVHYTGVIWRTGEEFDSNWGDTPTDFITTGVIPGFAQALEGQAVGSQVIALVPASSGYGSTGLEQMGYAGDDVMVFVIDILGTVHPEA